MTTTLPLIEILLGIIGSALLSSQAWVMLKVHQLQVSLAVHHVEYKVRIKQLESDHSDMETRMRQMELSRIK